jgi:hypothetical protein
MNLLCVLLGEELQVRCSRNRTPNSKWRVAERNPARRPPARDRLRDRLKVERADGAKTTIGNAGHHHAGGASPIVLPTCVTEISMVLSGLRKALRLTYAWTNAFFRDYASV